MIVRCGEASRLLSLRLDGPLSVAQAQALEEHLSACSSCHHYSHQLDLLPGLLGVAQEVQVPPGFAAGVMLRLSPATVIPEARPSFSPSRAITTRFLAAAALLGLLVALSAATTYILGIFGFDITPPALVAGLFAAVVDLATALLTLASILGELSPLFWPRDLPSVLANAAPLTAFGIAFWFLTAGPAGDRRQAA